MRICFFGDSFINGTGDDSALGWVGRVAASARHQGKDVTLYNLGIRGETGEELEARWHEEAQRRNPERLLFSFGANDCHRRVPPDRTVAAMGRILREAAALAPTIVIGPIPVLDDGETDALIVKLSAAQQKLCRELAVPFLSVHGFIGVCDAWKDSAADNDGSHPNQGGYEALAQFLLEWSGLRRWLGIR